MGTLGITVYPQVTADLPPASTGVLTDENGTLINKSQNATSFQWTIDGATNTQVSPTVSFPGAGTYDISLTATGPGSGNQAGPVSKSITVYARVAANFNLPAEGLTGNSSSFAGSSPGSPIAWTRDSDGTILTGQSVSHILNAAGTKTLTLSVAGPSPPTGERWVE